MSLTIPKALEGNFKPIVSVGQSMVSPFFPLCLPPTSPLEGGPREVMPSTAWSGPDSWTPAQPRGSAMSPAKATITSPQCRNPQTWRTAGVVGGWGGGAHLTQRPSSHIQTQHTALHRCTALPAMHVSRWKIQAYRHYGYSVNSGSGSSTLFEVLACSASRGQILITSIVIAHECE